MAKIKEINFSSVGRMMGCTCDKCGQYIQNIWTVTFTDGVRMNYGIDCFRKLCATGNLSDYGKKLMNKALKSLKHWQEKLEAEKLLTEETDVGYQRTQEHVDWKSDDYWYGKPWAEYHEWMLTQWYPQRFKEEQEVIDRFSGISFRREDGEILNNANLLTLLKICNAMECRLSEILTDRETIEELKKYLDEED